MSKDISFNSRISILVGINGSGKTSVLNLVNWLLTLNFSELCIIEFESVTLEFGFEDSLYMLTCRQNESEITLDLVNLTTDKIYPQIQATFHVHPKKLTKNKTLRDSTRGRYVNLDPEEHEIEAWDFIVNKLPSPTVIGLDRNLYAQEGADFQIQDDYRIDRIKKQEVAKNTTPINRVKTELVNHFNTYRNSVLAFYSSINRKIVLSAFDNIITDSNLTTLLNSPKPTIEEIRTLEGQMKEFLRENKIIMNRKSQPSKEQSEISKVEEYFSNLKKVLTTGENRTEKFDLLYLINITQFEKINELVQEFKRHEEFTNRLYKPIEEFLSTLNSFFNDSSKELYFDKDTSQLFFRIKDRKNRIIDSGRDIDNLSSGEKQILILLTYIKYNSNLNIFIIDEPELSLHPKWQGEFLNAVEKLMPKEAQLILATHSPEIAGENDQFCEVLLPYS